MIPTTVCIDLEQDGLRSTSADLASWQGAIEAFRWASALRARHHETPIAFNWFVRIDRQVRDVGGADAPFHVIGPLIDTARADGDAFGIHPHQYRQTSAGWLPNVDDVDHLRDCLNVAVAGFDRFMGHPPVMIRWGDRTGHPSLGVDLVNAGLRFDLTAEPGRRQAPLPAGGGVTTDYADTAHRPVTGSATSPTAWPISTVQMSAMTLPPSGVNPPIGLATHGSFDEINDACLFGWAAGQSAGATFDEHLDVTLHIDGQPVLSTHARWFRADLLDAGIGDGNHGFMVGMRPEWIDIDASRFDVGVDGRPLAGSRTDRRTSNAAEATTVPITLSAQTQMFERMIEVALADGRQHLAVIVRSDAFAEPALLDAITVNLDHLIRRHHDGAITPPLTVPTAAALWAGVE